MGNDMIYDPFVGKYAPCTRVEELREELVGCVFQRRY